MTSVGASRHLQMVGTPRRRAIYYEMFDKPKIVFQELQVQSAFRVDDDIGAIVNDTVYIIPQERIYFLLGSAEFRSILGRISERTCSQIVEQWLPAASRDTLTKCLVPTCVQLKIEAALAHCGRCSVLSVSACNEDPEEFEIENQRARVARLYGLKSEE